MYESKPVMIKQPQDMLKYNLRNLKLPILDLCYLILAFVEENDKDKWKIVSEEVYPFTGFFDAKHHWRYENHKRGEIGIIPFILNAESADLHIPKGIPNPIKTIILEKYSNWVREMDEKDEQTTNS